MTKLEASLICEENDLTKQIEKLDDLKRSLKSNLEVKFRDALERNYDEGSYSSEASDSRTHILCIVDKLKDFAVNRKFYQLRQASEEVISKFEKHEKNFSTEPLDKEILTQTLEGLNAHQKSLQNMHDSVLHLKNVGKFNEHTKEPDLRTWAKSLELFGEELEDNLAFLSFDILNQIESMCETIVLISRQKGADIHTAREEWRRRLRYAAGFILNLIETATEDAIAEDEKVIQDFFGASQSSLKNL